VEVKDDDVLFNLTVTIVTSGVEYGVSMLTQLVHAGLMGEN
jgi:hypothetical protein